MWVEWPLSISARRQVMLYISTECCEIISNDIKVIERTRFLYGNLRRGIIPHNWPLLISACRPVILYIYARFREIIMNGVSKL